MDPRNDASVGGQPTAIGRTAVLLRSEDGSNQHVRGLRRCALTSYFFGLRNPARNTEAAQISIVGVPKGDETKQVGYGKMTA